MLKHHILASVIGLSFSSLSLAGESVQWFPVGRTSPSCAFSASLDILNGYPVARLKVDGQERVEAVVLLMTEAPSCRSAQYFQAPRPSLPPSYELLVTDRCMGRLPTFVVTRSLSGVQSSCEIETP